MLNLPVSKKELPYRTEQKVRQRGLGILRPPDFENSSATRSILVPMLPILNSAAQLEDPWFEPRKVFNANLHLVGVNYLFVV